MAVQPSQSITDLLSTTLGGRSPNGAQSDRSGTQASNSKAGRVLPEPVSGYDPKAPRGTYVDIVA